MTVDPSFFGNRRQHPRAEVAATALVIGRAYCAGPYLVENLSAGGALIMGEPRLSVGERVSLVLHLSGREKPFRLSAEVIRTEGVVARACNGRATWPRLDV